MEQVKKHTHGNDAAESHDIQLISLMDPHSPVVEAYRTIRTNIQFANLKGGTENALKTIIMTSSVRNAGKSTTIANLALVLAQAGSKVLLVDCDLRNPTIHKIFKLKKVGMTNLVATGADPEECVQTCDQENLYILPAGPVPPNPSELLCSRRVEELMEYAKGIYDYILLDMPPVLPVTDAAVMSSKVDGVIMCVACNTTHPRMEQQARDLLEQAGANIIGVIMNKVDVASSIYYGKYYGHSYNYGYYYYYYGEEGEKKHHHHHRHKHRFGRIGQFFRNLTNWSHF